MDDLIEALTILKKHLSTEYNLSYPTHCEHDVLMVGCHDKNLPQADADRLNELGFKWSDEYESWVSNKFGSY